ncbi:hypothetical protein ZWY2020_041080 [Hordeum vulgare]|nr:hypothetical protein ZWY2020_041080 [Hordeum vulgare]
MAVVSAPPVSSVVVTVTAIGSQSSALVVSAAASGFMSPTTVYTTRCVPEDQTGAAKQAMIQVELMTKQVKGAYDAIVLVYNNSVVLQENVRKPCEIGSRYTQVESEKSKLKLECDAMKKLLEDKVLVLAKVKKKCEAEELKLADFRSTEEKLKALQVADTKKLRFEDFMETFIDTATRISAVIDIDTFVESASPGEP